MRKKLIFLPFIALLAIIGSLTIGGILILRASSSSITHTSQSDWDAGTVSSNLDSVISDGDLVLASSTYSTTQTSYADFASGTASSTIDLNTNQGDLQLTKIIQSEWTEDGIPMATTSVSDNIDNFETLPDGLGGAYIIWQDDPSGNDDIFAQRIDSDGDFLWTYGGVDVVTNTANQGRPSIATTSDGFVVSWVDYRNGNWDLYAQKFNSSGVAQWTTNGVVVCASTTSQFYKKIINDGSDEIIIVWFEPTGFYAQKLDSSGVAQWGADGVKVEDYSMASFSLAQSGDGGVVIAWSDDRNSYYDVYAQKVNSSGIAQWTAGGVVVSSASDNQISQEMVKSSGDFIIFWNDYRNGNSDIYAQKINSSGVAQWTTNGVSISTSTGHDYVEDADRDSSGGALISWVNNSSNYNVYVQKINSSGVVQWTHNGKQVTNLSGDERYSKLTSNGSGGAIIVWEDDRNGDEKDIYAQKINSSGNAVWKNNGIVISDATKYQSNPLVITDESGGAIIFWKDSRKMTGGTIYSDYYAAKILANPSYIYDASGVFTSSIIDVSSLYSWSTLTASTTIPTDTTITIETRTKVSEATNYALTGTALGSSEMFLDFRDDYAIDNNYGTVWINNVESDPTPALTVTLAATSSVNSVRMSYPIFEGDVYYCADYTVEVSPDGSSFATVVTETGNSSATTTHSFTAVDTQIVRFNCTNAPVDGINAMVLGEFGVYDSNPDMSWTSWEAVSDNNIQSADGRFIQYRLTLSTTDTSVTPIVSDITINSAASYNNSGMYVSSVLDSSDTTTTWDTISAESSTSASTTITYATRSGNTATPDGTWSDWATTTSAIGSASVQYLQYRAFLSTTDTSFTPTLSSMTLSYSTPEATPVEDNTDGGGAAVIIAPITSPTTEDPETGEEIEVEFSVNIAPPADFNTIVPTVTTREVNLTLVGGPNTVNMAISEYPSFAFADLIPYSPTTQFILSEELGEKTIYAKFYTNQGVASDPVSCLVSLIEEDDILIAPITPETSNDVEENIVEKEKEDNEKIIEGSEDNEGESYYDKYNDEEDNNKESEPYNQKETRQSQVEYSSSNSNEGGANLIAREKEQQENKGQEISTSTVKELKPKQEEIIPEEEEELEPVIDQIRKFASSTPANTTSRTILGTYIALSLFQFWAYLDSLAQLPYLIINLFGVFAQRRRKEGTVYDANTGQPISFAKVSIYNKAGQIMKTKVTDKFGSYFFLVPKGEYKIKVMKKGYELVDKNKIDKIPTAYNLLYSSDKVLKYNKESMIHENVPLQAGDSSRMFKFFAKPMASVVFSVLLVVGVLFTLAMTIFNPSIYNILTLATYLFIGLLKWVNLAKPTWGMIKSQAGKIQPFAFVQAFASGNEANYISRAVSDEYGRYAFVLDKGKYTLEVRNNLGQISKAQINLKKRGIVDKNLIIN